jgi:hypothetical protein
LHKSNILRRLVGATLTTGGGLCQVRAIRPLKQISLVIDCSVAGVDLERAAALLGIKPRTLRAFLKRLGATRAQKAKSVSAPEGRPGGASA